MAPRPETGIEACPPCPAPLAGEQTVDQAVGMDRRRFLRLFGGLAIGGAGLLQATEDLSELYTNWRWPPAPAEIRLTPGAERLETGHPEWLVFGGFGQQHSPNATPELYLALGEKQVVSSLSYPSQTFNVDDLAETVAFFIKKREIPTLRIVGVSAGLPIALQTFKRVQDRINQVPNLRSKAHEPFSSLRLPEIDFIAGYSSPANLNTAIQGAIGRYVLELGERFDYKGEALGKFIFNSFSPHHNVWEALSKRDRELVVRYIVEAARATGNDSPPQMAYSQVDNFLRWFDITTQGVEYSNIFRPSIEFGYCAAEQDVIVNDRRSYQNYHDTLLNCGVPEQNIHLMLVRGGHATTASSAEATARLATSRLPQPTRRRSAHSFSAL